MAVAVLCDDSPLVAAVKADGPIREPKDFEGKTLAAPDFDAGRQLFPIFAKATEIDGSTIAWISVKPELREPMLIQGQAGGVTGFVTSTGPSLARLGPPPEEQRVFSHKDHGVGHYSTSILTTRAFPEASPEAVRTVLRCETPPLVVAKGDGACAAMAGRGGAFRALGNLRASLQRAELRSSRSS